MTIRTVTIETEKPILMKKSKCYMLYDHILRNGGKMVFNKGTWGNPKNADSSLITKDDMQTFCLHHDKNCRISDMGKSITTVILPNEKPIFFCTYHWMVHSITEFYTESGIIVEEGWHP